MQRLTRRERVCLFTLIAGTLLSTWICLRIEYLIIESGYKMPPDPIAGTDFPGTWRYSWCTDEVHWRERFGPRDVKGKPLQRALTPDEFATMTRMTGEALASNKLLKMLESWGLLQHLLVPIIGLGWFLVLINGKGFAIRISAAGFLLLTAGYGFIVVYRGYFWSLGW